MFIVLRKSEFDAVEEFISTLRCAADLFRPDISNDLCRIQYSTEKHMT